MLHKPFTEAGYTEATCEVIRASAGRCAADRDRDGHFPGVAFDELRDLGLIARPLPDGAGIASLFRLLAAVGHGDLSVGRIFEGHVNALFLIQNFGTSAQRERYQQLASDGEIFGVWNTDMPGEPVTLEGTHLQGRKNFASGVDGVGHAIATASSPSGRRMIIVPVTGLTVDRTWWNPLGMRASGSHVVNLDQQIEPGWILGGDDDFILEPWFSAGAIRFAAVHVGGMHAVFDAVVTHLRDATRIEDPHQRHRVGQMGAAVEAGYAWLDRAAKYWLEAESLGGPNAGARLIAIANAARLTIESHALYILGEAERSVGAAGMIAPHPLERLNRDLRTYLRQPNPDGALTALGSTIAGGGWAPGRFFDDGKAK